MQSRRFVLYHQLRERYGITYVRVHLRRLMAKSQFPLCVNIGPGRIGWYEDEIELWVTNRPRTMYKAPDDGSDYRPRVLPRRRIQPEA